jgi:hypothetical protein
MPSARSDWLQHLIEQEAEALSAIVRARHEGRLEDAHRLIREAARTELGMDYRVLTSFDVLSVAELLAHHERVRVLAQLVAQEAEVLEAEGRGEEAEEPRERARMLTEEAYRMSMQDVPAPWSEGPGVSGRG